MKVSESRRLDTFWYTIILHQGHESEINLDQSYLSGSKMFNTINGSNNYNRRDKSL